MKRGLYLCWRLPKRLILLAIAAAVLCVGGALFQAAASAEEGIPVPVVMYHSLLRDPARQGDYVVSPDLFESDLRWLMDHGYTPVTAAQLIAYPDGGSLPEKPVLITFDDGYFNNYSYAYPIARSLGCPFLLSPIGEWADYYSDHPDENPNYSQASWERLAEMADSGLVELGNHSYALHGTSPVPGLNPRPGEGEAAYRQRIAADLTQAQDKIQENTGCAPQVLVYPYGAHTQVTLSVAKELGFACTLTCEEKVSRLTREPDSLYELGRYRRPCQLSSDAFFRGRMGLG